MAMRGRNRDKFAQQRDFAAMKEENVLFVACKLVILKYKPALR
jgi:hypothetical protein